MCPGATCTMRSLGPSIVRLARGGQHASLLSHEALSLYMAGGGDPRAACDLQQPWLPWCMRALQTSASCQQAVGPASSAPGPRGRGPAASQQPKQAPRPPQQPATAATTATTTATASSSKPSRSATSKKASRKEPSGGGSPASPASSDAAAAPAATPDPPSLAPDTEVLLQALLQPLPLGRHANTALLHRALRVNRTLFLDPAAALESTMRALYVVKRVLSDDGHVVLINSNPLLRPLLREAALCCLNPNVWFMTEPWGADSDGASTAGPPSAGGSGAALFRPEHQPSRELLAARGVNMVNPHCMQPDVLNRPAPKLHMLDKWALLSRRHALRQRGRDLRVAPLLRQVVALEQQATRLPLPSMLTGNASKLRLMVALDLTHDLAAVEEAYARNVMTISLVNAHSDLSRITYPVYAGENHLKFQHFFLDWILKVVNMPPPQASK